MKKNLKYILPAGGALLIILVVMLVFLFREEAYRIIQVSNIEGSAEVDREEIGLLDAYNGMMLQSKDDVEVEKESYLYLKLDEDKYVMMEPETKFHLEAAGNSEKSKTVIQLASGAVVNRLDNKLSEEASYEVATPNSTMAIRGTVFRVEVIPDANGTGSKTLLSVFEGEVACTPIQPDGTSGEEVVVTRNKGIEIRNQEDGTVSVEELDNIDYGNLDKEVLEFILTSIEEKGKDGFAPETEDTVRTLLEEPSVYTVTFKYNGNIFATQMVNRGEYAVEPMLQPSPSGVWEFDFSKQVFEDTEINWVAE